jgi:hypothetical protein
MDVMLAVSVPLPQSCGGYDGLIEDNDPKEFM